MVNWDTDDILDFIHQFLLFGVIYRTVQLILYHYGIHFSLAISGENFSNLDVITIKAWLMFGVFYSVRSYIERKN